MKAVVTVIGKDMVGLLAAVSGTCADANANVVEVNQSLLGDYFAMVMLIDISNMTIGLDELQTELKEKIPTMQIHVMHEDIFNSMHNI